MNNNDYLEKVYSGLIGMCAGVRLGAPVEPTIWTYERIRDTYGDIRGYVKDYRNFAADDDVNGPVFFIHSLMDFDPPLTAEKIGKTWLNYAREGIGFYWWGGYGRSTEHTAYLNLKNGIPAPESGSIKVNGSTIAEQIGGQIFIDSWGLVFPDNPEEAARYAAMAASVSHDGNGLYGAVFVASLISMAFSRNDISPMIDDALKLIPVDCEYARVVNAVKDFYSAYPEDWRAAREMLTRDFGYDRYPGVCHIIPNSGVIALALYYGEGDFARTIEIATMSGWDTDCNAGNAGTILGVMNGIQGIAERYRGPINDFHAASSISGALNILDLPTVARELAILGLKEAGAAIPEEWKQGAFSDDLYFDFSLSGSTHGFRTSSDYLAHINGNCNSGKDSGKGGNGLSVVLDRFNRGDTATVYFKPFYRREDFDDERYSPTFTPLVYSGQILRIEGSLEKYSGQRISFAPYVRDSGSRKIFNDSEYITGENGSFSFEWKIPETGFAVDEIGLLVQGVDSEKYLGMLEIDIFSVTGKRKFEISFEDEVNEFKGTTRCSINGGAWNFEKGCLHVITNDFFQLYTGPYYSGDYMAETVMVPEYGESHMLLFRSAGAERGYYFGFSGKNRVELVKKDHTETLLAYAESSWEIGKEYILTVYADGDNMRCLVDNQEVINYTDSSAFKNGMAGLAKLGPGRTSFRRFLFRELGAGNNT